MVKGDIQIICRPINYHQVTYLRDVVRWKNDKKQNVPFYYYDVVRGVNGKPMAFMLYFVKGDDGIWRIEEM